MLDLIGCFRLWEEVGVVVRVLAAVSLSEAGLLIFVGLHIRRERVEM